MSASVLCQSVRLRSGSLHRLISALDLNIGSASAGRPILTDPSVIVNNHRQFSIQRGRGDGGRKGSSKISRTSVFVQTGIKIRELPLVVTKVNNVLQISGMDTFRNDIEPPTKHMQTEVKPLDDESVEIMAGFDRCHSVSGLFRLLETIPLEEVTPEVAVHALKTVISLEASNDLRNPASKPANSNAHRGTLAGVRKVRKKES